MVHRWCATELQVHQPAGQDSFHRWHAGSVWSQIYWSLIWQPAEKPLFSNLLPVSKTNIHHQAQQITFCAKTHFVDKNCDIWGAWNQPLVGFLCRPTHLWRGAAVPHPSFHDQHLRKAAFLSHPLTSQRLYLTSCQATAPPPLVGFSCQRGWKLLLS